MIKHVWFDFSETIAFLNKERHDRLRYESYAEVVGRPVDAQLIAEFEDLYEKFSHSNAAIFRSLGLPSDFWSKKVNTVPAAELYVLADPGLPEILKKIKDLVPISLFSNIHLKKILPTLGIDPSWFTHILDASTLKEPKPALEGFYKMVELTNLPADEILYIGDHVEKDVLPAKRVGIRAGIIWTTSPEADYSFKTFEDVLSFLQHQV